jgi:hypothetical protein
MQTQHRQMQTQENAVTVSCRSAEAAFEEVLINAPRGHQTVHEGSLRNINSVTVQTRALRATTIQDSLEEVIFCPFDFVGRLIGKGGNNIKRLQAQTHCQIKVDNKEANHVATAIKYKAVRITGVKCVQARETIHDFIYKAMKDRQRWRDAEDFIERNRAVAWHEVLDTLEKDRALDKRELTALRRLSDNGDGVKLALKSYNKLKDSAELVLNLQHFASRFC